MKLPPRICGALLLALLASPTSAHSETVLKVIAAADLRLLDPLISTDNTTLNHAYLVYDTLFGLARKFTPQLQMLARYDVSPDHRIHTFTLRPGQKFHDGTPVTAEDCVASIKRWAAKDTEAQAVMANTISLAVVDAATFRWELREPYAGLPAVLAKSASYAPFILPARLAATPADKPVTDPTGSGPFRFVASAWQPASAWEYVRNPDYAARAEPSDDYAGSRMAHVDRIRFTYTPDQATKVSALVKGEVDMIEDIPTDLALALAGNPNVVAKPRDTLGVEVIMRFNQSFPPFDNKLVRQAVLLATNQRDYLAGMAGDAQFWQTCGSMFYCGTPYASTTGPFRLGTEPDLDRARALLKSSGYNGEPVTILQPGDHAMSPLALVAADSLRKLGINATVQTVDYSTMMQRRTSRKPLSEGGWSIFFTRWEGALQNPTIFIPIGAACEKAWYGWPCDAEIERLRTAWVRETDPTAQARIVDQLNARAAEEVPFVNLGQVLSPMAWRKTITGIPTTATMVYWTISKN